MPLDTTNAADITKAVGLPKDRRIYVGNLPDNADAETLKQFCKFSFRCRSCALTFAVVVNQTLLMCGAVPAGVKTAVLSLWMSSDNKYGFLELCSADVATVAMGLNGINYGGCGESC